MFIARSAITFESAKQEMSFVRPSVRKIIHFCGRHMRGGHMELLTGSLTHRFFGIPKVDPPKRALRLSIRRSGVPFFAPKSNFFVKHCKKLPWCLHKVHMLSILHFFELTMCDVRSMWILDWWSGQELFVTDSTICFTYILRLLFQASRPCRARCI